MHVFFSKPGRCLELRFAARALVGLLVALSYLAAWGAAPDRGARIVGQPDRGRLAAPAADPKVLIARLRLMGVMCLEHSNTGLLDVMVSNFDATDDTVALLEPLGNIGKLTLSGGKYTENCLDTIVRLKKLQELTLFNLAISESGMEKLGRLPTLSALTLFECHQFTDETMRQLAKLKALEKLAFLGRVNQLSDAGFAYLGSLPSLVSLQIAGESITDEGLRRLARCKSLSGLRLEGHAFSDEGLRFLARMQSLHDLSLNNEKITAAGIRHLKSAGRLENLQLIDCPRIDDDSLSAVGQLSDLRILALAGSSMTDDGLAHLNRLKGLHRLTLENSRFTGAGLASLTALVELTDLFIKGENVSNAVFAHLHQFPKLQTLNAGGGKRSDESRITDAGLKLIGHANNLSFIILIGTRITEKGLEPLNALPALEFVNLVGSPGVENLTWQPRRKMSVAERQAADPLAAAERQTIVTTLRAMGAECFEQQDTGRLSVEVKGPHAGDAMLAILEGVSDVERLTLSPGRFTEACFDSIAKLAGLQELNLREVIVSAPCIEKLTTLPSLVALGFQNCEITDADLRILSTCTKLKSLALDDSNCQVTEQGFEHLASIPALESLRLVGDMATDEGFKRLAKSKSITSLTLVGTEYTDEGLQFLAALENLQTVEFHDAAISGAGLGQLKTARRLQRLVVYGCPRFDDDTLVAVGELSQLRGLHIGCESITDDGLAHLNTLVGLESLTLDNNSRFTGAGLASLTALLELNSLNVRGERVSDAVFAHLGQFPKLTSLQIGAGKATDRPGVTDEGLKLIGQAPNLERLLLEGTGVTDAGLAPLRELPALHFVDFRWTPGVRQRHRL